MTPGFERIDKREARKRYNAGETLFLVPCNVDPNNCWGIGFDAHKDNINSDPDFDKTVMYFEWYNCQDSQMGKYTAFYLRKES